MGHLGEDVIGLVTVHPHDLVRESGETESFVGFYDAEATDGPAHAQLYQLMQADAAERFARAILRTVKRCRRENSRRRASAG